VFSELTMPNIGSQFSCSQLQASHKPYLLSC